MRQIDWCCFANRSGYAQAAIDYIGALKLSGKYEIKVDLLHSAPEQLSMTPQLYADFVRMMRIERKDDAIQFLHCIPNTQHRVPKLDRNVGFATFETYDPPEEWISVLNENRAVICPSEFNVGVFKRAGVTVPIHHIPHCFDARMYNPSIEGKKNECFTFLFLATWKKRKGWDILLEAWMKEFRASDNVRLLIKTDRYTMANMAVEKVRQDLGLNEKEIAPISFEGRVLNDVEMPRFLKSADCLVCPTLGEGFGIPGLQCMALGVPVVITNFSGCTDYAKEETATLIQPDRFIVYGDMDQIPQFRNKKWANVTPASVRTAMRYVVDNADKIKEKSLFAADFVTKNFSYEAVAPRLGELVDSLL